jgi:hypothetical protein
MKYSIGRRGCQVKTCPLDHPTGEECKHPAADLGQLWQGSDTPSKLTIEHLFDIIQSISQPGGWLYWKVLGARSAGASGNANWIWPQTVRVAGLVVVRQRPPTAKGHVLITVEDEEGPVHLIVRPDVYERYWGVLRGAP